MKLDWNKRYTAIACYAFLVIFCVVLCIFAFLNWGTVREKAAGIFGALMPIFYGMAIAYMLCPSVKFFENRVFGKLAKRKFFVLRRILALVLTFLLVILAIVLFCWLILPRVLAGYADLQKMSSMYIETVKEWLFGISFGDSFFSAYFTKFIEYMVTLLEKVYSSIMALTPDVMSVATALVSVLSDVLLGIILSIYFLLARERLGAQTKKIMRAFLNTERYRVVSRSARLADKNFGGFIKGQIADALVMGVLSYFCLLLIGVPYYPLVSVLIGIANIVPVFGSILGTLIGTLIIFLANPHMTVWFLVFMIILHWFNRHMIKPYIIRVGVDASMSFMFTAIIIMTGLIGFWGILLGVPVFVVAYALLHSAVDKKLANKGLPTDLTDYYATDAGKELYREKEMLRARKRQSLYGEEAELKDDFFVVKPKDPPKNTEKDSEKEMISK